MTVEVFVHAGAHRTGSSSFQMCLHLNAQTLHAVDCDLAYPARDGVPGGQLKLRLPRPRDTMDAAAHRVRQARKAIDLCRSGRPRLVLSEENLLGRMLHFYQGRFYPHRRRRLVALRTALPGPVAHLLLVVRPYDALFASAWRLRAQSHAMPDFASLRPRFLSIREGWPEVVRDMRDILRPRAMTIVDYRAGRESRDLLARLVPGVALADLAEPERRLNTSLSDAELRVLQTKLAEGMTPDLARRAARFSAWAGDTRAAPIASFSEAEVRRFQADYEADLHRIAIMSGIRLNRCAAA